MQKNLPGDIMPGDSCHGDRYLADFSSAVRRNEENRILRVHMEFITHIGSSADIVQ